MCKITIGGPKPPAQTTVTPTPSPPPPPTPVDSGDTGADTRRKAAQEARQKRGVASTILGGKQQSGTILGLAQMNDAMKKQLGE